MIPEGGRGASTPRGAGRSGLRVAADDLSRVAYAELLSDERKGAACGFMARALAFYEGARRDGRVRDDRQRLGLPLPRL